MKTFKKSISLQLYKNTLALRYITLQIFAVFRYSQIYRVEFMYNIFCKKISQVSFVISFVHTCTKRDPNSPHDMRKSWRHICIKTFLFNKPQILCNIYPRLVGSRDIAVEFGMELC